MSLSRVEQIANAVLYEGYILYPYRPSSVKNQQRWNFGALYPEAYSRAQNGTDACLMQTECLLTGDERTTVEVKIRFLHLLAREAGEPLASGEDKPDAEFSEADFRRVGSLEVCGKIYQTWQEAVERDVCLPAVNIAGSSGRTERLLFDFPASHSLEVLRDEQGHAAGALIRTQRAIQGAIELQVEEKKVEDSKESASASDSDRQPATRVFKLTARILNLTPLDDDLTNIRDEGLLRALVSTHTILNARDGEFVSLLDTPASYTELAAACSNIGTWPVMVGEEGERGCMLSSPIILYDYPQIAPESAGDLFDGTEIDEILTLRIMTLTDEEKREMRSGDERARQILERTEMMPAEQLMKLHGVMRSLRPPATENELETNEQ